MGFSDTWQQEEETGANDTTADGRRGRRECRATLTLPLCAGLPALVMKPDGDGKWVNDTSEIYEDERRIAARKLSEPQN